METQYPNFSFGIGKDGDDWTVELRDSNTTVRLPTQMDGVKVRSRDSGPIKTM